MINPYDAALELATLFGNMEYALKRAEYVRDRHDAQADWKKFASDLGSDFFEHIVRSDLAKTLINNPPRRLVRDGLKWEPKVNKPLTSVEALFEEGICRVRNNYLHGEKFVGQGDNWERDAVLVQEALDVLREAKNRIPAVAAALAKR